MAPTFEQKTQGLKFLSTLAGLVFFSHQVGGFLGWQIVFQGIEAIHGLLNYLPIREQAGRLAQAQF